ncbi:unnamed protein product [Orchesella dallaii]|uniref:Uncharacterized protein n=1 Tax=Orchesella dallaii TaxID=48710 RepID=A0ABP1S5Y5_9HEXA
MTGSKLVTYYSFRFSIILLLCNAVSETTSNELEASTGDPTINLYTKSSRFRHTLGVRNRSYCPNARTYLIGARIRSMRLLDETAQSVTAIELICSDRIRVKLHPNFSHAKNPLVIEKNVGVWSDIEECPNGLFATGLTFHLQPHPPTFNIDYDYDSPTTGRSHFISGLSLNCVYEQHKSETNANESTNATEGNSTPSSITIGQSSELKVDIACQNQTVISGAEIFEDVIISHSRARKTQVKLALKCSRLENPALYCAPELRWERINNVKCHTNLNQTRATESEMNLPLSKFNTSNTIEYGKESKTSDADTTTCQTNYAVGVAINSEIMNLDSIISAYNPNGLDKVGGNWKLGEIILNRLLSPVFRYDWKRRYNLKTRDYKLVTKSATMYANLKNMTYDSRSSAPIPNAVSQVIGYCSVYKIYFPIVKEWLD